MTIEASIDDARSAAAAPAVAVDHLLTAPILPTLLRLAVPNTIAMFGSTLVAVAETSYIGRLGTEPLAGIALGSLLPFAAAILPGPVQDGLSLLFSPSLPAEAYLWVFLPPLLFLDGWRIPKDELLKDLSTVVELALGLVILTVVGMGLFIHWMIPAMPLVRRQNIRHNSRRRLAECGPRQGVDVRRRTCGAASADVRWSVA